MSTSVQQQKIAKGAPPSAVSHNDLQALARPLSIGPSEDGSQFEAWRSMLSGMWDLSLPAGADPAHFQLRGSTYQLPYCFLHRARGSAMVMERSARYVAAFPVDHVSLFLCEEGRIDSVYGETPVAVRPGDIVFLDYRLPMVSHATDFASASIMVERDKVPARFRDGKLHGTRLSAEDPMSAVVRQTFLTFFDSLDRLRLAEAEAVVDAICTMCAKVMTGTELPRKAVSRAAALDEALALMKANLADPNFSAAVLVEALGLSRPVLYRLFAPLGGVSAHLLSLRLEASLKALVSISPHDRVMISDIAFAHGFRSATHFSRAFRQHFGITPSEIASMPKARGSRGYNEWLMKKAERAGYKTTEAWLATT